MERLKNPKLIAALVVAAVALIIFLQNQETITLEVLFLYKVETKVATALGTAFFMGVVTGFLAFSFQHRNKAKTETGAAA
jgi:uncharacterized membrane protein YciS (DUF1049 family)